MAADVEAPPASGPRLTTVAEAFQRFLRSTRSDEGLGYVKGVVVWKLYGPRPDPKDIDQPLVDWLASDAMTKALTTTSPPWTVRGIKAWVRRLTLCAVVDAWRREQKDKAYLNRDVDVAGVAVRHAPATDYGAREYLLCKWLERQLGDDPVRRQTFRMMWEHGVEGYTYEELARKYHSTPNAIELRCRKLRKELAPKVALMDRENVRRGVILFLFGGGIAAAIALIVLALRLLLAPSPVGPVPPPPDVVLPPASATASTPPPAPSFDQALPPDVPPAPAPTPPGTEKPGGRK